MYNKDAKVRARQDGSKYTKKKEREEKEEEIICCGFSPP